MDIGKKIVLTGIGIWASILAGSAYLATKQTFGCEYRSRNYYSIEKPLGIGRAIEFKHYEPLFNGNPEDEVTYANIFGEWRSYSDGGVLGDYDGSVDFIHKYGSGRSISFDRKVDYERFKKEFDRADKELAKAKKLFENDFKKYGVKVK